MKVYITKTHVINNNISGLDRDLQKKFGFERDIDDEEDEFIEIIDKMGYTESEPIEIDVLIEALSSLKKKGANYVQLEYHCDHIEYNISGYNIRLSTEDEINEYELKNQKLREKRNEIAMLRGQINKLENETT